MRTQRELIATVAKKLVKITNITKAGKMMDILDKYVETNIDFNEMKDYIPYALAMDMSKIKAEQLPGESKILNGIWFFLPDEKELENVIKNLNI